MASIISITTMIPTIPRIPKSPSFPKKPKPPDFHTEPINMFNIKPPFIFFN